MNKPESTFDVTCDTSTFPWFTGACFTGLDAFITVPGFAILLIGANIPDNENTRWHYSETILKHIICKERATILFKYNIPNKLQNKCHLRTKKNIHSFL